MPFDLTISITGLSLFAVEEGKRVSLLMPTSGGGPHAEPHSAQLAYNPAHLVPDATGPYPGLVLQPMGDLELDLAQLAKTLPAGAGGDGASIDTGSLPVHLFDLTSALGRKVDPALVGPAPDQTRVHSRVRLPYGKCVCYLQGAKWEVVHPTTGTKEEKYMAFLLRWRVSGIPDDARGLVLTLANLDGSGSLALPPLHPVGGSIDLWMYHLPPRQMPPSGGGPEPVGPGDPPPHIEMLYRVFVNPATIHRPEFHYKGGNLAGPRPCDGGALAKQATAGRGAELRSRPFGDQFTCAPARGTV